MKCSRLTHAPLLLAILFFSGGCKEPIAIDTDPIRAQLIRIPFLVDRSVLDEKDRTEFQTELREYLNFLEVQHDYGKLWRERRAFRGTQSLGMNWGSRWAKLNPHAEAFSDLLFDTGRRIELAVGIAAMETQLWVFCIHEGDEESCKDAEGTADFTRSSFADLGVGERLDALLRSTDLHPTTRAGLEDLRRETLVTLAQSPSFPARLGSFESWVNQGHQSGNRDEEFLAYLQNLQSLYDGVGEDKNGAPRLTTVTLGFRDLDFETLVPVETLVERTNQVRAIRNSLWWSAYRVDSKSLRALSLKLAKNILLSHECQLRRATASRILADPIWSKTLVPSYDEGPVGDRDRQNYSRDLIAGEIDLTRLADRARSLAEKRPQVLAEIQRLSRLFGEMQFSTKFVDRALAKLNWSEFEIGIRVRQELSNVHENVIAELLSPLSDDCKKK